MNLSSFISSMLPNFTRSRIEDDLDTIFAEYNDHVKPCFEQFRKEFKNFKFTDSEIQSQVQVFDDNTKFKYDGNHVVAMYDSALMNIPSKIDLCRLIIEDKFTSDVLASAINALQINVIQLVEVLAFVTRFARRYLNFVITKELSGLGWKDEGEGSSITEAEQDYIKKNFLYFVHGLKILHADRADIKEAFEEIPDILVNKDNVKNVTTVSGEKTDPLQLGFIPVFLNPIYHIGIRIAEYQAARYKEAQHDQQVITSKILYLRKKLDGKQDAHLEKVIENYEELARKQSYKIAKMEEQ